MVFEYAGPVDRNKLDELVEIAEARSLAVRDGVSIRKRLFNVLVEGLENIHRHTPIEFADSGFALLERRDGHYRVVIGNTLPAASAALLSHRVEVLNDMGMKVWIDQDLCTGDGLCEEIAPDVFTLLDDGLAYVREGAKIFNDPGGAEGLASFPESQLEGVIESAEECPGECIFIEP